MPYSVDSDANKENPTSPSTSFHLNEQLLYKLAALDASVQSGFRRIDEKMDRFQTDLHDSQIATNDRINKLDKEFNEAILRKRNRLDAAENRVSKIETWQQVFSAKIAVIGTIALGTMTLIAPYVRHALGVPS